MKNPTLKMTAEDYTMLPRFYLKSLFSRLFLCPIAAVRRRNCCPRACLLESNVRAPNRARPAFSEMMALLLNDGVRTVLVESLSRVGRTLRVQECVIADFERKDLRLISVNEPDLLSGDDTRVLMRQMLGAFFEYEKKLLVAKLKGARERMRTREGRCEGRKPFGTRPGEQEIIERIQMLARKGMNYSEIAARLNGDGLPTRANGAWYPATVSRILARAQN